MFPPSQVRGYDSIVSSFVENTYYKKKFLFRSIQTKPDTDAVWELIRYSDINPLEKKLVCLR